MRTIILAITLAVLASQAQGQDSVLGMSQQVYKLLNAAQTQYEEDDSSAALETLQSGLERFDARLSDYELSHIKNMMAVIYQDNDQSDKALALYQEISQYPDLPSSFLLNVYRNAASISMSVDAFDKALDFANKALENSDQTDADLWVIRAQAQYYLEQYDVARLSIEQVLDRQNALAEEPNESWLQLANAIYYAQKDYESMIDLHYRLLEYFPRDKYLLNLAALFGQLDQADKQLALTEAVFEGGYITDSNKLMSLASLLLLNNVPYKAAIIMEQGIENAQIDDSADNIERLGQAWLLAGEDARAIPYLQQAAEQSDNGETYVRLANAYMSWGQWPQTLDALNKAIEKGGLRDPGSAYLVRGMAQFRLKIYDAARQSFTEAETFPATEKLASQWQVYMDSELKKLEALKAS